MNEKVESQLRSFIRGVLDEYMKEKEDDLEEITTTGDVDGYSTPHAFSDDEEKKKKKMKTALDAVGYEFVNEELESNDVKLIRKLIRDEVASIIRDIWIKRTSWR